LSLEQIDILYQNSTPITSVAYRRQLIAEDVHAADVQGDGKVFRDSKEAVGTDEKV
jgi:hypothetical protein